MGKIDFVDMTDKNAIENISSDEFFDVVNEILFGAGSLGAICKLNTKQLATMYLIAGEMILHTGELTGKIESEEDKNSIRKVVAEDVKYRKKLIKDSGVLEKIKEIEEGRAKD